MARSGPHGPADGPQYISPLHAVTILRRRKLLLASLLLLLGGPAAGVIVMLAPYYDADTLIMVATGKTEFSDLQAREASGAGPDATTLRTQSDIIRSPMMARRVADRLGLAEEPEFAAGPKPVVTVLAAIDWWLGSDTPEAVAPSAAEEAQRAADLLAGKLTVTNDGRSYIIALRVRTADRALGTRIANTYAELYLDFARQLKLAAIARGNAMLDAQLAPLRDRVRRAEDAVEAFREANGMVLNRGGDAPSGPGVTVAEQQLSQLNAQLVASRDAVAQKEASLRAAQRPGFSPDAIPEVVASPLVQRLREQEATLTARAAGLDRTLLTSNPVMLAARASVADIRQHIDAEVAKTVAGLAGEAASARAHRDALQSALAQAQGLVAGQGQAGVSLRQLQSEADAAKAIYKDYLWRYEQTSNQAALQQPEADLVSAAEVPLAASGPPRGQLAALAAVIATLLAALLTLAAERLRAGLRTGEQLELETGLFPLGFIPIAASRRQPWRNDRASVYAEAVNLVGSLLRHGDAAVRARVVLVTSAAPREGKTFFAISLAASAGRDGGRALLIDCDVWRPRVAALLGLPEPVQPGDAPRDLAPAGRLRAQVLPGVDVVTFATRRGQRPRPVAPEQIAIFIGEARDRYDLIVLDTPPVLAFADAPVLASLADGAIIVAQWGQTSGSSVLAALRTLRAYGVRVVGGVVTQVQVAQLDGGQAGLYRRYARYFA